MTLRSILTLAITGIMTPAGVRLPDLSPAFHPVADSSIFAPLAIQPAPSTTRAANGAPGPQYWQNRADYDIKATLDTATKTLSGNMTLRYTNNSPDTLKVLWFQTEQRSEVIDRFDQMVGGKPVALAYQHPADDVLELQVTPAKPLPPGKTTVFQVQWHFEVPLPDDGGGRMGRTKNGMLYEMAQWYPRPNVYDDVKGWNTESYATGAEFYLEFGNFKLEVMLPASYIVAATGTLDNPKEVLTVTEVDRLAKAANSETPVAIITADEMTSGAARPARTGMLTWKFHADNVRDAVWAASPKYLWDVSSWHGVLAQSYYLQSATAIWGNGAASDMVRTSIQEYSERWWPYPYPQVSVVDGPVFGDEYPMLSFDGDVSKLGDVRGMSINEQLPHSSALTLQHGVLTHEVGHNWFPMIVGSNERMHTWMDEGFDTFINSFSEARRYPQEGDQRARLRRVVYNGEGPPIETGKVVGNSGRAQYGKPAYALQLLRQDILGPTVFDSAFRTYIRRWAYKHPTPADFFRTMEDVSRRKLDWYWREAFLESPRFDQTIDSVTQTAQGTDTHVTVTYGNKGRMVLPLLVRLTFSDSTTQDVSYPVDVWQANSSRYTVVYTFHQKTVNRIALDPDNHLSDADKSNNVWTAK